MCFHRCIIMNSKKYKAYHGQSSSIHLQYIVNILVNRIYWYLVLSVPSFRILNAQRELRKITYYTGNRYISYVVLHIRGYCGESYLRIFREMLSPKYLYHDLKISYINLTKHLCLHRMEQSYCYALWIVELYTRFSCTEL